MKNKILTYLLLSVFLFSTMGVPISLHYCRMMDSVSFQSCTMCKEKASDCCQDDNYGTIINSSEKDICCNTKFVAEPLTEKYISASSEIQKVKIKTYIYIIPNSVLLSEHVTKISYATDNSPPDIYSNSLYITNSIFLI